jgi:hypothetical protein
MPFSVVVVCPTRSILSPSDKVTPSTEDIVDVTPTLFVEATRTLSL